MQAGKSLLSTRLIPEDSSVANGRQQKMIRQKLQPPHPRVLL